MERTPEHDKARCNSPPSLLRRILGGFAVSDSSEGNDDDTPLVVDISVYASSDLIPCDLWPTENDAPTAGMYSDLVRLEAFQHKIQSSLAPGLGSRTSVI